MKYVPTIGLEIHAELKTRTKMFCRCINNPDETRPNVNICPICTAHPGSLPVINKEAVRHILRIGFAVGGKIAETSEFDRKSYFYPDIPKGYQISQYAFPFINGGKLMGVNITRIHLEEDTARSTHSVDLPEQTGKSSVDFNRAGIPLMELVTEPEIHDAETAGNFARELQLLLRTLEAGDANLEKGEMRVEANVSVSDGNEKGTKVEIKNLNSFRSVEKAIAFEIQRQTKLLNNGGEVVQETRGWDEIKQETFHQRFKEESADYRYFPEPDLPKLFLSEIKEFSEDNIRASLPELPAERRKRYADIGLKLNDIEFIVASPHRCKFFDMVLSEFKDSKEHSIIASNYFISDMVGEPRNTTPKDFAKLILMFVNKELSSRGTKDVLAIMVDVGGDPETIANERGLIQIHDSTVLTNAVNSVLAREEKAVLEYKKGKQAALQYLIGQVMKESHGAGNPSRIKEILIDKIS